MPVFFSCSVIRLLYNKPVRWACFYGESLSLPDFYSLDLMIADPDVFVIPPVRDKSYPLLIAYISLGEVENFRWYWKRVEGAPWVLEENKNWGGDFYLDVRDPAWRTLVLNEIIPHIIKLGYRGLFLDTIDTAEYLEWRDKDRYAGSINAMAALINEIRKRFPKLILVSNNGLPVLAGAAPSIDYFLTEGLYNRYFFETKTYGAVPREESTERERAYAALRSKHNAPVLVLDYAGADSTKLRNASRKGCRRMGFNLYMAEVDLHSYYKQ
jgi:uncharacterized protein (TIGR01370 family)